MTFAQVSHHRVEPERRERTVGGLHAFLLDEVASRVPNDARVLDAGCGTGAWLFRLLNAGYSDLHGIDLDDTTALLRGIDFQQVDLERADWQLAVSAFDLITVIEVIEHIGNRTNFLRNLRRHLSSDGLVLLTTPNVHNVASRLRFTLTGSLRQFNERSDRTHYQPVFLYPFELLLKREGFRTVRIRTYPPKGTLLQSRRMSRYFLETVRALLPDKLPGEILVMWLAKEPAGDAHQGSRGTCLP